MTFNWEVIALFWTRRWWGWDRALTHCQCTGAADSIVVSHSDISHTLSKARKLHSQREGAVVLLLQGLVANWWPPMLANSPLSLFARLACSHGCQLYFLYKSKGTPPSHKHFTAQSSLLRQTVDMVPTILSTTGLSLCCTALSPKVQAVFMRPAAAARHSGPVCPRFVACRPFV